ncbi:MAG: decaprenyl-phosphate phosphoribosyltransferase [Isosphaeraceae bacterium]|nr:decaprenyl-phosphate phosphoribosyltransferase [Isosphaeraceae bacterium]
MIKMHGVLKDRETVLYPRVAGDRNLLRAVVQIARPSHWVKNLFVVAPLLFGGLPTWQAALRAVWAFGCFCLLASGIYCLNDVIDAPADRLHPRKRQRPVASGAIPVPAALALAAVLIGTALLGGRALSPRFVLIGGLYVLNNLIYFAYLKHRVIVDVLLIAIGFVLRILAGCAALGLQPSPWILACGFSLALLLGFGKRRLEVDAVGLATGYRRSLQAYSAAKLNLLLGITASVCLLSYMLYTVSPQTIQRHGTENLIYTVPLVAYGIFRYLFQVQEGRCDGPVEVLLHDPVFTLIGLAWIAMVGAILFIPSFR